MTFGVLGKTSGVRVIRAPLPADYISPREGSQTGLGLVSRNIMADGPTETIMSMNWSIPYGVQGKAGQFWSGLATAARRWWSNYTRWRIEQLAIAQLHAMSDYELKDIGLKRSDIENAVKVETMREHIVFRR